MQYFYLLVGAFAFFAFDFCPGRYVGASDRTGSMSRGRLFPHHLTAALAILYGCGSCMHT